MAIAFVRQSTATASPSSTSATITITAPTNGNALVLFFNADNSTPVISSISQTGATWVIAKQSNTSTSTAICYALNVSGASTSVTINSTGSMANIVVNVAEFSGVATSSAADGTGSSNSGSKTTTATTGAFSTTNANDVLVVCVGGTGTQPTVQPTGFTALTFVTATASVQPDYDIVNATQSGINPQWTIPKSSYDACAYALQAAVSVSFIAQPSPPILQAVKRGAYY